jgi:aspartate oxidase
VERDARGLHLAAGTLADLHEMTSDLGEQSAQTYEVVNLVRVARAITDAAMAREESRGAHFRSDFPRSEHDLEGRFVLAGRGEPTFVPLRSASVRGAIGRSR